MKSLDSDLGRRMTADNVGATTAGGGGGTTSYGAKEHGEEGWERRPGGMLVQKRRENLGNPVPVIRVRVAHGDLRYQISVSSQATFGELKKLLTPECGLQHWEQRLIYRGKERENKQYLDLCGVKDRSKLILMEDPCCQEQRFIEMRKLYELQRVQQAISYISTEVDTLAQQVSAMEKSVASGVKVPEVQIATLIEMLMAQAVKLDNIPAHAQNITLKNLQGKRVQKCVETLDMLKISNANAKAAIVTTKWHTFDPFLPITPLNLLD